MKILKCSHEAAIATWQPGDGWLVLVASPDNDSAIGNHEEDPILVTRELEALRLAYSAHIEGKTATIHPDPKER